MRNRHSCVVLSLVGMGLSLLAGCGSPGETNPGSSARCLKDTDCKSDRLCVSAECVDPQAVKGAGGSQAVNAASSPQDGGTEPTTSANPLSCSGSKEASCLAINPRGETTVDRVSLHSFQIRETFGWELFSGSGIFGFYLLERPSSGDYQVEPYSSRDIDDGFYASVPISLKGVHVSLRDPAHSSQDHYLATSGTIHINIDGSLLIADWDDVEVHSAERVSNFTGGRSRGHIVFYEGSQTVSVGAAGGGPN